MIHILITGFEPFGGETINPSYEAIKQLDTSISGANIHKLEIPTVFNDSINVLIHEIKRIHPDVILMTGQAGGRKAIEIERIAININDSISPDNNGYIPTDEVISSTGPAAYFSTLPIKKLHQALNAAHIKSNISNSAGTYVCNHVMYGILDYLHLSHQKAIAGFIHVPYIHDQVRNKKDTYAIEIGEIINAFSIIIKTIVEDYK